ncbi:hypothetical protein JKP88DRAFT_229660 [Tribonema minus]|uniref:Isoprenylcysteine carboxylmethyltransferase family protein n=1 Tax=Tribonema minus TaxID=303371 RepID=A0A836C7I2_9STRA|nr:hypothetical protein JKP88DRAFT_229660 [Tribonema minus]
MKLSTAALALSLAAPAVAFVPMAGVTAPRPYSRLSMVEKVEVDVVSPGPKKSAVEAQTSDFVAAAKDVAAQVKNSLSDLSADGLQDDLQAALEGAKANVKAGKVGERGEVLTLIPYAILALLIVGDIPLLGGPLEFLAGPGLLLAGGGLILTSLLGLGKNLSPWPQPCENNVLITTGVYSICRHPMYAGLLAFSFGLGFATDSFTRIALAALLLYTLDKKATEEEKALEAVHPAYKTYQEEVPKFFPLLDKISLPKN